jgi:hypothetical protein
VAAVTNYHTLDGLKTAETDYFAVLEARSLKSRYGQGWFLSETNSLLVLGSSPRSIAFLGS